MLLVPGYGGSAASLQGLATRLREAGRDVTVVDLPDRAQGDLTTQADALGATAAQVRARTRAPSVDVVGYSAGGVVARLWTTEGGGAGQVRRLVMLGSPLHGTDVARLGTLVSGTCPTACQQLAPDSALLSRLDATALPPGVLGLSLWSTRRRGRPAAQLVGRGRRPEPLGAERLPGEHREPRRPADGPRRAEHRPRSTGHRPGPVARTRGLRPAQLVTSRVVKFAQAARRRTPTYTACNVIPLETLLQRIGSR